MTFALSIVAERTRADGGRAVREKYHTATMVSASNADEATGLGHRLARRIYPVADGWYGHHALAGRPDVILTADTVETATVEFAR